jgi:anti-sigma factor RsiW
MDHSEAVRVNATERYFLQELTPDQLAQFEEHFFECPECAVDVQATAKLLEPPTRSR